MGGLSRVVGWRCLRVASGFSLAGVTVVFGGGASWVQVRALVSLCVVARSHYGTRSFYGSVCFVCAGSEAGDTSGVRVGVVCFGFLFCFYFQISNFQICRLVSAVG